MKRYQSQKFFDTEIFIIKMIIGFVLLALYGSIAIAIFVVEVMART